MLVHDLNTPATQEMYHKNLNHTKVARLLLERGANPNTQDLVSLYMCSSKL